MPSPPTPLPEGEGRLNLRFAKVQLRRFVVARFIEPGLPGPHKCGRYERPMGLSHGLGRGQDFVKNLLGIVAGQSQQGALVGLGRLSDD